MSQRTNHPLKTLFLLAVVAAIGWGAYEFIYVRGILRPESSEIDVQETRERLRTAILDAFETELCLKTVDEVSYRATENHYRIRITLGHDCVERARDLCVAVAASVTDQVDESLGVFAYDAAGNLMAKFIE